MTPGFFQNSILSFFDSSLLINFAEKLVVINLLIYEQMNNKRKGKGRKNV